MSVTSAKSNSGSFESLLTSSSCVFCDEGLFIYTNRRDVKKACAISHGKIRQRNHCRCEQSRIGHWEKNGGRITDTGKKQSAMIKCHKADELAREADEPFPSDIHSGPLINNMLQFKPQLYISSVTIGLLYALRDSVNSGCRKRDTQKL